VYGITGQRRFEKDGEGSKKLRETVEWNDIYAPMCEGCREVHGDKNEDPPCETCRPEFLEENDDAVKIFYLTRNQLIMTESGPIDIMHEPIHSAMKLHGVLNKKECFEKVLLMSNNWITRIREK